jgi:hypothetical protein
MTVILLRHGRSTSNTAHTLAGRSEGVDLDDKGREQALGVVARMGDLPVKAIVRSPLLRCERTVEPLADALGLETVVDDRLIEVDYGQWTGRKIGDLVKEPLWAVLDVERPCRSRMTVMSGGRQDAGAEQDEDDHAEQHPVGDEPVHAVPDQELEEPGHRGVADDERDDDRHE